MFLFSVLYIFQIYFYNKIRQPMLLRRVELFSTKCDGYFITKWDGFYDKVIQELQCETKLGKMITKWGIPYVNTDCREGREEISAAHKLKKFWMGYISKNIKRWCELKIETTRRNTGGDCKQQAIQAITLNPLKFLIYFILFIYSIRYLQSIKTIVHRLIYFD